MSEQKSFELSNFKTALTHLGMLLNSFWSIYVQFLRKASSKNNRDLAMNK